MTDEAIDSDDETKECEGKLDDLLAETAISDGEPIDSVAAVRELRERDRT